MIIRCSLLITSRGQAAQAQNRALSSRSNTALASSVRTAPSDEDARLDAFRDGEAPVCRWRPLGASAYLSSLPLREHSAPVHHRELVFASTPAGRMSDCAKARAAARRSVHPDQPPSTKERTPAGWLSFEHRVAKLAIERLA